MKLVKATTAALHVCLSESQWNGAFVLIECCQSNVSLSFFLSFADCLLEVEEIRGVP